MDTRLPRFRTEANCFRTLQPVEVTPTISLPVVIKLMSAFESTHRRDFVFGRSKWSSLVEVPDPAYEAAPFPRP